MGRIMCSSECLLTDWIMFIVNRKKKTEIEATYGALSLSKSENFAKHVKKRTENFAAKQVATRKIMNCVGAVKQYY